MIRLASDYMGPYVRGLPAGREIDALVDRDVVGSDNAGPPAAYSTNPAATFVQLVPALRLRGWRLILSEEERLPGVVRAEPFTAVFLGLHGKPYKTPVEACGPTPELAIARAALLTVIRDRPGRAQNTLVG